VTATVQGKFPGLPRAKRPPRLTLVVVRRTGAGAWLLPRGLASEGDLIALCTSAGVEWTPGGGEGVSVGARAADDVIAAAEFARWVVKVVRR
jgi:hypothetical protein